MKKLASLSLLALLFFCGNATAEELKITDCEGMDRAMKEVEPASVNTVELRLSATPSAPIEINLKQGDTSLTGLSSGNKVIFKEVASGSWKACFSQKSADTPSISQVAIFSEMERLGSSQSLWLGGAGMAATGLGFGILAGSSNASGGSDEAGGSSGLAAGEEPNVKELRPFNVEDDTSGPFGERLPRKPPCAAEEACLNNDLPTPLSPIS